jgi:hypothetical protein
MNSLTVSLTDTINHYLQHERNSEYKSTIQQYIDSNNTTILQSLFTRIAFGTAGLRASIGILLL